MLTAVLGVLASLGPWGQAAANYFGYQKQRDSELNTPEMQAAAQGNQDEKDRAALTQEVIADEKAVASGDPVKAQAAMDQERKDFSK